MRDILRVEKPRREVGTETDVLKAWERLYKAKHWNRYAPFGKKKSGFNLPYLLLK